MSVVVPELHAITGCNTTSYKFSFEKVTFLKKVLKYPSSFTLIKMLGLNISMTKKLSKRQKLFVQTIIHNGKSNKNYLSTRLRLHGNLKPKSSIPLPPDPNLRVHLQCYVWLNALKTALTSLNTGFFG